MPSIQTKTDLSDYLPTEPPRPHPCKPGRDFPTDAQATPSPEEQERVRAIARQSKAIKLADLKAFGQNFKLTTPVPEDILPEMAKDEARQKEIVEKRLKEIKEVEDAKMKGMDGETEGVNDDEGRSLATVGTDGDWVEAEGEGYPSKKQKTAS